MCAYKQRRLESDWLRPIRLSAAETYVSRAVVALMLQLIGPLALISAFMSFALLTAPYSVTTSLSCICSRRHFDVYSLVFQLVIFTSGIPAAM